MYDIRKARLNKGLTQLQLANMIGYKSAGIIRKAEKGELKGEKLTKILSVLGLAGGSRFTVYTDGGCEVNPGGRGGYGVVIIDEETGEISEYNDGFVCTTNNRMEIYAVIIACENLPVGAEATVYSDSQYVVKTIQGFFRKNKNLDLWDRLETASKGKKIKPVWIRGHGNNVFNERCDELATDGYVNKAVNIDKGCFYKKKKAPDRHASNAMSADISVSDEPAPVIIDAAAYARQKSVNPKCAEALRSFYKNPNHNFRAYAGLKTFGLDYWSSKSAEDLKREFPKEYDAVSSYFESNRDIAAALRWKGRGLTLYDCIRKVFVDKEISRNAEKK